MRRLALSLSCLLIAVSGHDAPAADPYAMTTMRFVVAPKARAVAPPAPPYEIVGAKVPTARSDQSLEAFRRQVAAAARRRVYAALAQLVAMQFFWDRDYSGGFDPRLPAVENLAAAIRLEHGDGEGWRALEKFADEPTADKLVGRPGVVCAPAAPTFNEEAFHRLLDSTRSQAREWAYPLAEKTPLQVAPQASAATIDMVGRALVRLLADAESPRDVRTTWARIAAPSGQIGFVAPGALSPLAVARLCYGRDALGRWQIAGYVGGD